jgi:hypothetical protein
VLFGAVGLFVVLSLAYTLSIGLRASRGAAITGDEPFYLMTTQSLIDDGDLDLRQQYERRSWTAYFDHPDGLWQQSVPLLSGELLSPHDPGLSVLVIPGFLIDGLRGVQVQLLLLAATTFALTYVLTAAETKAPLLSWLVTAAVALTATPFVYATEIYPELPGALCLVLSLLVLRFGKVDTVAALMLVALLTLLVWFGIKYVPLGCAVGAWFLLRAETRTRVVFLGVAAVSGAVYVWAHYAIFDHLVPYSVNTVYEGASSVAVLDHHLAFSDRIYRLWGLLIDRRFGLGHWAPLFLLLPVALLMLVRHAELGRLVLMLVLTQVLIATFVAITMMGFWFPGRTLMVVLPLTPVALTLLLAQAGTRERIAGAVLAVYSLATTAALVIAARAGQVQLASNPFELTSPLFRVPGTLFPDYRSWPLETALLTAAWLAIDAIGLLVVVRWQRLTPSLRGLSAAIRLPRLSLRASRSAGIE